MSVKNLLSRLDKVKKTGVDSWRACCPAHGGKKQSLAIRDDNGKVLINCFAEGCNIFDVLGAVGLDMNDIQPRLNGTHKPVKKPFYAGDVLEISRDEIIVAYLIAEKLFNNKANFNDMQRLQKCMIRLSHACDIATEGNGVNIAEKFKTAREAERLIHE